MTETIWKLGKGFLISSSICQSSHLLSILKWLPNLFRRVYASLIHGQIVYIFDTVTILTHIAKFEALQSNWWFLSSHLFVRHSICLVRLFRQIACTFCISVRPVLCRHNNWAKNSIHRVNRGKCETIRVYSLLLLKFSSRLEWMCASVCLPIRLVIHIQQNSFI